MNQRQAIQQVTDVAVWARESSAQATLAEGTGDRSIAWADLADAADDLAAMIERDTFRATSG